VFVLSLKGGKNAAAFANTETDDYILQGKQG
jgi:hypothetical protein